MVVVVVVCSDSYYITGGEKSGAVTIGVITHSHLGGRGGMIPQKILEF